MSLTVVIRGSLALLLALPVSGFARQQDAGPEPKVKFQCVVKGTAGANTLGIVTRYEKPKPSLEDKLKNPRLFLDASRFSIIWFGRDYLRFAGAEYKLHGYNTHRPQSEAMRSFRTIPEIDYVFASADYIIEKSIYMREAQARVLIPMEPGTRRQMALLVQYYDGSSWQVVHCMDEEVVGRPTQRALYLELDRHPVGTDEWREALKKAVSAGLAEPID